MPTPPPSTGHRIARASIMITLAYIVFKLLSLVQRILLNNVCDTDTVNLFDFGFTHILMIFFLIGEEAISPALLPLFIQQRDEKSEDDAWRLANSVITAQAILLGLTAALIAFFPQLVLQLVSAWGNTDVQGNEIYREYAPRYVRGMAAAVVVAALSSSTYMLLSGYKRFFIAAFGESMFKIGLIASIVAGTFAAGTRDAEGHLRLACDTALYTFCIGALIGAVLKITTHLLGLREKAKRLRPAFDWRSPAFKRFLVLLAPLLIAILFAKGRDLFNNHYLLSTLKNQVDLPIPGRAVMKANSNGLALFRSLAHVVPMAVSIAMLPFLCEMVDRKQKDQLGRTLTASTRLMLLLFVPMAALLIPLARPLVDVLFLRGQFSPLDAELTALSCLCYAFVLPFIAIEPILSNVFFSQRRTVFISVLGIVFSTLMMATNAIGILGLGLEGRAALILLGVSFTVWRMAKVLWFALALRRRVPCFPVGATLSFLARLLLTAAAGGVAAWAARSGMEALVERFDALSAMLVSDGGVKAATRATLMRGVAFLVLPGLAGALPVVAGAWALLPDDVHLLRDWIRERLRRRRQGAGLNEASTEMKGDNP